MKKLLLLLTAVLFLAGCAEQKTVSETESTVAPVIQIATAETEIIRETEEVTQPTLPPLPWDADARWYRTYYFDKRPNPDRNIVEGVVRFNVLLRNEAKEIRTVQSVHVDFYMGTENVAQEDFDSTKLSDFFFHPGVGDLEMEYGESTVFQVYSTNVERGTYDRAVVTVTVADSNGGEHTEKFHFAEKEADVTPYATSDRTDWDPASRTQERWDFHMFPRNDTDGVLEYVGIYGIWYQNGIPMDASFQSKSETNPQALKDIQTLMPGQMMHYQTGVTHKFNTSDEREFTMVYRDAAGERYLQTFRFALDEENAAPDPFPLYLYTYPEYGVEILDTPALREEETGKSKYTRQEIRQMIDDGLSLDALAEKITTISEVQLFIQEYGLRFDGGDIKKRIDGMMWHFNDSPQVVLQQKYGDCGSGSNLINYLLQGDYDEQGYLKQAGNKSGHIFNYFRSGERYYIYDWTRIIADTFDVYIADSLEEFSRAYVGTNHILDAANDDHHILLLYAYPYEGCQRPMGDGIYAPKGVGIMNVIPDEIKDIVTVLYAKDERSEPIYVESPPVSQWPEDALMEEFTA